MKILNILFIAVISCTLFISCKDNDDFNTENASIGFKDTTFQINERKGLFKVPVVVKGKQNGKIEFDVQVAVKDPSVCVEDKNFIVTSKHLIIPEGKTEVGIEILAIDDRIQNKDREFTMTITNAKGATTDSGNSINVVLLDNDNNPYERLAGNWHVSATNIYNTSGTAYTSEWDAQIVLPEEDSPKYGKVVYLQPWPNFDGIMLDGTNDIAMASQPIKYSFNESTGSVSLEMPMGEKIINNGNIGMADEKGEPQLVDIISATISPVTGMPVRTGSLSCIIDDSCTRITIPETIYGLVYIGSTWYQSSAIFGYENLTLTIK